MAISDQELLGYNPEAKDIDRKRKLAELLMARGMQQPQGQMISGRYVAPSFTQNLSSLFDAYQGNKIGEEQDQRQLALAEQLRKQEGEDLSKFYELQYGGKQIPAQAQAGPMPDGGNIPIGTTTSEPNPQAAFEMASQSRSPMVRAQLAQMLKERKTGEGDTITRYNPVTGKDEVVVQGKPKYQAPKSVDMGTKGTLLIYPDGTREIVPKGRESAADGFGVGGSNVNNNGVPVGKYDKVGRYISPNGQVFPATAVTEARKEHDAATDLAFKLNRLTGKDIKDAYGSTFDYSASKVGQFVGSEATVSAQNKINNIQIKSVLDNLSQLKGAASDKDMAQMIKDFPGYTSSPDTMEKWVERAAETTNRFLKRSENRFGFDTEYAEQGRFDKKKEKQKGEIAAPNAPKVNDIRDGADGKYRFKGGDQYDKNNWEKVK
jgi:hypothetical protein